MITASQDADLFQVKADAIVNAVNCKGVMGKGIAREFKKRFPRSFRIYLAACQSGNIKPGLPLFVRGSGDEPNIIHFPTKNHWRGKSRLDWIRKGLAYLKSYYKEWGIASLAMPQLGCGLGGLDWMDVKPLIEEYLGEEQLDVIICLRAVKDMEPCYLGSYSQLSLPIDCDSDSSAASGSSGGGYRRRAPRTFLKLRSSMSRNSLNTRCFTYSNSKPYAFFLSRSSSLRKSREY